MTRRRILTLLAIIFLAACTPLTAAQYTTANSTVAATAQMDQYRRDAEATGTARAIQFAGDLLVVQNTARAATATTYAQSLTETAMANVNATSTARSEQQMTETLLANATATARAELGMTQAAEAHATATRQAEDNAMATAVIVATQTQIKLDADSAETWRVKIQNAAMLVLVIVAVCVAIYLIFNYARVKTRNADKKGSVVTYGPHNNPLVMTDKGQALSVVNPLTTTAEYVTIDENGNVVVSNSLPEWMRLQVLMGALSVLNQQAQHNPFPPVPGQPEQSEQWKVGPVEHQQTKGALPGAGGGLHLPTTHAPRLNAGQSLSADNLHFPADARWEVLEQWNGGQLPLGLGMRGLLVADPEQYPHWLIAGATGSGKSRYALKPLITAALAAGWQVIIFDRNGLHFSPFKQHPNAIVQLLDEPEDLIGWLDILHLEVNRRFKFLAQTGAENWANAPDPKAPRLLAVVDDFSILGDMLDSTGRRNLWLAARRLAADSRKSGIHLALAVQNPTWQSIDLGIRRNCTPLTFRVNDSDASRVILNAPGAETLSGRQFLTVMNGLVGGMAFAPTDEQIAAFLASRPVTSYTLPGWLEQSPSAVPQVDSKVEQIRALHAAGKSLNAIQDEVFGYRGGAAYAAVKAALGDTGG